MERLSYAYGETPHERILERIPENTDDGTTRLVLEPGDVVTILSALLADGSGPAVRLRARILDGYEIGES